ncbi:RES domain-containing protein [Rhizobium tibeticum]|uniref:RES family NAD+ phosphorylase n=1 Tax=Rhizobium tibeticum TaxID=501024 RepID=UPI002782F696|nr:RES family NAD+ phosphorylase [Rhizobium tibeticum]MDP9810824.1 RES domain-containing protein [Rhizobium tibeticum]
MRYEGKLYRALNPIYARQPFSGRGAELYGGRFNPKGMPALYTSLSVMTALREANQVGNLQPITLVSYDAAFESVYDSRDEDAHQAKGMDAISDPTWRDQMKARGKARTQDFARRLAAGGYHGLLLRSFAPGATGEDLNLVLWEWAERAPARLILIDEVNRLGQAE